MHSILIVVNAFVALGGSGDKSGMIDLDNLKKLLNDEIGLQIDVDVSIPFFIMIRK